MMTFQKYILMDDISIAVKSSHGRVGKCKKVEYKYIYADVSIN